jgi:hypothetical protein
MVDIVPRDYEILILTLRAELDDARTQLAASQQDAERYEWAVENAIIETESWRHDGKDPASTKHVLDRAIDQSIQDKP